VTLPVNHVVLASGAISWTPPEAVEYVICSALYDPQAGTMRLILEGADDVGDEFRSVFYWDKDQSSWLAGDYQRRHAMLLPVDFDDDEETL
jgi:hypothetical protein